MTPLTRASKSSKLPSTARGPDSHGRHPLHSMDIEELMETLAPKVTDHIPSSSANLLM